MAEPVGAALGLYAASLSAAWIPFLLSFSAGAMIFVSVHELIPMSKRYGHIKLFLVGIAASIGVHTALTLTLPI